MIFPLNLGNLKAQSVIKYPFNCRQSGLFDCLVIFKTTLNAVAVEHSTQCDLSKAVHVMSRLLFICLVDQIVSYYITIDYNNLSSQYLLNIS